MSFPDRFLWGVATSAYQVEGSARADGRGDSIWDRFSHEPGRIAGGGTGDVACDHYRRWRDDVELIAGLGLNAYRFSIAWPRLFPTGSGALEPRGRDHYDRLIDALLERGITPLVTLYHWDLPLTLQDRGGWRARDTVERFAEYAAACFEAYGDRVGWWVTINEPWIFGLLGYLLGLHAPGERDLRTTVEVFHHLLLGHGRAVEELRASGKGGRAGIAFALAPHYPASASEADRRACRESDAFVNRWFLDAALRGSYPDDMRGIYKERIGPLDFVRDGDLAAIGTPSDFVGVNFYFHRVMRSVSGREPLPWEVVQPSAGARVTDSGAEVVAHGLTDVLIRLRDDYGDLPVVITENGAVYNDEPGPDGRVRDARRIEFLYDHLVALGRAIDAGVDVRGYFHWSLMDNFEWAEGYTQRFGIVHVDFETQARTVKDSGRYYSRVAAANDVLAP